MGAHSLSLSLSLTNFKMTKKVDVRVQQFKPLLGTPKTPIRMSANYAWAWIYDRPVPLSSHGVHARAKRDPEPLSSLCP